MKLRLKIFSMFTGIGGLEIPFNAVGCKCIGYSEIERYAMAVFNKHFPNVVNFGDAEFIDTDSLPNFDLLTAGSPCQDFSIAGKRAGLEKESGLLTRSGLFHHLVRIADIKRPKYILFENVKGLLNLKNKTDGKYAFDEMMKALSNLGYSIDFEVLNSKYFGLSQNRERVIVFACLSPYYENEWTDETDKIKKRLINKNIKIFPSFLRKIYKEQELKKIVPLNSILEKRVNKKYFVTKPMTIPKISDPNNDLKCVGIIPESIKTKGNYFPRERVFSADGIGRALTTSYSHLPKYLVGKRIRNLSPIEIERMQGFPDDWTKLGIENKKSILIPELNRYELVGNAVPVSMINVIVEEFSKWLIKN